MPADADLPLPLRLLREARTIAVVGISSRATRPSYQVTRYLIDAGYTVYLVNPDETEVFGLPVYDRLQDLLEPVDIVDVFRLPGHIPPVVEDAIEAHARAVWLQLGIVNEEAAARARAAGLEVVMDRCTKIEHQRLLDLRGEGPAEDAQTSETPPRV
ncbi:MAG: CoA-binding protein [Dehalococcoidia bacterium]